MTREEIHIREPPTNTDGPYSYSELRPDIDTVNEVVKRVSNAEGELCIAFTQNIGATPYVRPTPYPNNQGVMVNMWSCISQYPKAVPGSTLLFGRRSMVWPDEPRDGDAPYRVNIFTKEWVWNEVRKAVAVEIVPVGESPFCTDWYNWNWENRQE